MTNEKQIEPRVGDVIHLSTGLHGTYASLKCGNQEDGRDFDHISDYIDNVTCPECRELHFRRYRISDRKREEHVYNCTPKMVADAIKANAEPKPILTPEEIEMVVASAGNQYMPIDKNKQIAELTKELDKLKSEREMLFIEMKDKRTGAAHDLEMVENQLRDVQMAFRKSKTRRRALEADNEHWTEAHAHSLKVISELTGERNTLKAELEAKLAEAEKLNADLDEAVTLLCEERDEYAEEAEKKYCCGAQAALQLSKKNTKENSNE
jgi:hypothetical protein